MMTAGLDATLVGSLDKVQIDSTDYLCLSGFAAQRLALVSSLSLEEVAEQWKRLQLGGQVVQVGKVGSASGRRVYYFSLASNIESTLTELRQLLSDQAVKTIDLLMPLGKTARSAVSSQSSAIKPSVSQSSPPTCITPPAAPIPFHAAQREPVVESEEQWPDLDQLVDDFDSLDL